MGQTEPNSQFFAYFVEFRRVFRSGVALKSLGSHVIVVRPCMVVGDCCHVGPDDCHHSCRCVVSCL